MKIEGEENNYAYSFVKFDFQNRVRKLSLVFMVFLCLKNISCWVILGQSRYNYMCLEYRHNVVDISEARRFGPMTFSPLKKEASAPKILGRFGPARHLGSMFLDVSALA